MLGETEELCKCREDLHSSRGGVGKEGVLEEVRDLVWVLKDGWDF